MTIAVPESLHCGSKAQYEHCLLANYPSGSEDEVKMALANYIGPYG